MDIMEFLKTRRTYRRFEQKPVEPAIAREIMEAARIASCGANRQTLKYVLVQSPEMVAKMQPLVHWAAYLPPEQGQPKPDETPVLFVAVCQDESLPGCNDTDTGLALANMTQPHFGIRTFLGKGIFSWNYRIMVFRNSRM